NHDECVAIYCLMILAFTPCGDALSIDAMLYRSKHLPSFVYSMPILLMQVIMSWAYFTAGILKLRLSGLHFFNPDNLPVLSIQNSLDNLHDTQFHIAFWLPAIRAVLPTMLVVVVLWEILFPLVLFVRQLK